MAAKLGERVVYVVGVDCYCHWSLWLSSMDGEFT
jgi:hypothetical protein